MYHECAMTMDFINNQQLIEEVQRYPCLYNINDPNYKDLEHRASTWEVICREVYEGTWDEFEPSQKKEATADVQKRWKALRDSFTKAYKLINMRKAYGIKKKRKPYVYSNQLEFLIPFMHQRRDSHDSKGNDFDDNSMEETDLKPVVSQMANSYQQVTKNSQTTSHITSARPIAPEKPTTPTKPITPATHISPSVSITPKTPFYTANMPFNHKEENQKLKRKAEEVKCKPPESEQPEKEANDSKNVEEDADKMFLLSLLPSFKRIRPSERLDVQIEILQCIKRKLS